MWKYMTISFLLNIFGFFAHNYTMHPKLSQHEINIPIFKLDPKINLLDGMGSYKLSWLLNLIMSRWALFIYILRLRWSMDFKKILLFTYFHENNTFLPFNWLLERNLERISTGLQLQSLAGSYGDWESDI